MGVLSGDFVGVLCGDFVGVLSGDLVGVLSGDLVAVLSGDFEGVFVGVTLELGVRFLVLGLGLGLGLEVGSTGDSDGHRGYSLSCIGVDVYRGGGMKNKGLDAAGVGDGGPITPEPV